MNLTPSEAISINRLPKGLAEEMESRVMLAAIDSATPTDAAPSRLNPQNFKLYWSDEFDDDEGKWVDRNRDTNDYVTYSNSDVGTRRRHWRPSQTDINDGVLSTRASQIDENGKSILAGGGVESQQSFNPNDSSFGKIHIEARVKLDRAQGAHSAFWMLPSNGFGNDNSTGADGAEVDIYETNKQNNDSSVWSGMHINGYGDAHQSNNKNLKTGDSNIYDDWNTVGLTWSEKGVMEVWWNGQLANTWTGKFVPKVDEYLLFSSQLGGEGFDGALPSDLQGNFSAQQVDWVRVYKKTN